MFTARSQLTLSVIFLIGYFAILILFMLGYSKIPDGMREIFSGLVGFLSAAGLTIITFWFNRVRGSANAPQA